MWFIDTTSIPADMASEVSRLERAFEDLVPSCATLRSDIRLDLHAGTLEFEVLP